jgi:hypothetical protein
MDVCEQDAAVRPKREEVTRRWTILQNEIQTYYASQTINRIIKQKRMGRAGHGRDEKHIQNSIQETRREETIWEI